MNPMSAIATIIVITSVMTATGLVTRMTVMPAPSAPIIQPANPLPPQLNQPGSTNPVAPIRQPNLPSLVPSTVNPSNNQPRPNYQPNNPFPTQSQNIGRPNDPLPFNERDPHIHGHLNPDDNSYTITTQPKDIGPWKIHDIFDGAGNYQGTGVGFP